MRMELAKLFYVPVFLCASDRAVKDEMFVDITDTFSDIIWKHYQRNIRITISAGIWKMIQHIQKNSRWTFTEIIDRLVWGSQRRPTCFLSDDMVRFRFTLDYTNQIELYALGAKDHLGKESLHIFFPSENGHMHVKRRVHRCNH